MVCAEGVEGEVLKWVRCQSEAGQLVTFINDCLKCFVLFISGLSFKSTFKFAWCFGDFYICLFNVIHFFVEY